MNYKELVLSTLKEDIPPTWRTTEEVQFLLETTQPREEGYRYLRVNFALGILANNQILDQRYRPPTIEEEQDGYGPGTVIAEFRVSNGTGGRRRRRRLKLPFSPIQIAEGPAIV